MGAGGGARLGESGNLFLHKLCAYQIFIMVFRISKHGFLFNDHNNDFSISLVIDTVKHFGE